MYVDDILKMIGLFSIIENPEKYRDVINLISESKLNNFEHGYYDLKTGNKYNGTVYIHGNGSPYTDGYGNIIEWR